MKSFTALLLASASVMKELEQTHEAEVLRSASCTSEPQLEPVRDPLKLGLFFRQMQVVLPVHLASDCGCLFWRRVRTATPRCTNHRRRSPMRTGQGNNHLDTGRDASLVKVGHQ